MAADVRTDVFFYGTLMSPDVLRDEFGVESRLVGAARLEGYRLTVNPRVNLESSCDEAVYGSIISVSATDVARLYKQLHAQFGLIYRPVEIDAVIDADQRHPAVVYITDKMEPGQPDADYVRQLADCARALEHPDHYVTHIESFLATGNTPYHQPHE